MRTVVVVLVLLVTVFAYGYDWATTGTTAAPALDAHGHYVHTGDLVTHYESWGNSGPAVVLVHGFLESAATWSAVGSRLGATHRVYALDVRGYGYTERKGPYTLASDTEQLSAFLTALHLDAAHRSLPTLVGHSSGAAIIGDLARLQPQAVAQVVFMDGDGTPYGVGPAWVHRLLVDPYATALIRLSTRHPSLAASMYRSTCGAGCPPFDSAEWLRPFHMAGAVGALKSILRQQLIGLTYAQEEQIHVRAAVMFGSADDEMTAADAGRTAARLHTDRIITVAGAHHLPMLSDPQTVATALARL